jgi:hypothetical protein
MMNNNNNCNINGKNCSNIYKISAIAITTPYFVIFIVTKAELCTTKTATAAAAATTTATT